jgi:hypothetical protein
MLPRLADTPFSFGRLLQAAELVLPDMEARALLHDLLLVVDIARSLPAESCMAMRALYVANSMINAFKYVGLH